MWHVMMVASRPKGHELELLYAKHLRKIVNILVTRLKKKFTHAIRYGPKYAQTKEGIIVHHLSLHTISIYTEVICRWKKHLTAFFLPFLALISVFA